MAKLLRAVRSKGHEDLAENQKDADLAMQSRVRVCDTRELEKELMAGN